MSQSNTTPDQTTRRSGLTRRQMMLATPTALAGLAALGIGVASARQDGSTTPNSGSVPTTGGARPGPMGSNPGPVALRNGPRPIAVNIDKYAIAAEVEVLNIVDGAMQNPTGPFVVSWYEETANPGELGNVVLAGHVDYYTVGPAIFYDIYWQELAVGDRILVTGENDEVYTYETQWQQLYTITELTPEIITELIFPQAKGEFVTLITCGGEFDPVTAEYNSRVIVRGKRIMV